MRKIILVLILLLTLSSNKAYEQNQLSILDKTIISDLTLIRNTYNWVNNDKIKKDMIRKQNRLVYNKELKTLYKEYLINEKVKGD